ncbi:YeeE/YedE family protein [Planctobacterium marinum]|uniref:YeeE/YedE family protein n=1 Tax=Planctobacterium marinum TaxID=1631968 RepID=UPI001E3C559F|nr:YeeE/YedE thiosulfate transporter family protein [Planctobacterium marinum]MCC2604306.1 YeeE/YedE family protein [Planctobacterium marinum]
MTEFTPLMAMVGGVFIGLAGVILLLAHGRVMGVSGLVGNIINAPKQSRIAVWFILGLLTGPAIINAFQYDYAQIKLPAEISLSWWQIITGAVLVGVGTRMGAGCTSGHGICGIGRFSLRSVIATCVFMLTGIVAVALMRHLVV